MSYSIVGLLRCWDRSGECCSRSTRKTSITEYIELYSGPPFELAEEIAFMMLVVTACMFYGNVMPFLYLIAFFCLLLLFWFNKLLLYRVYKKPANYDKAILNSIKTMLIIPLVAHCLGGVVFMNQGPVFPEPYKIGVADSIVAKIQGNSFWRFIQVIQVYPYLLMLVLIILFLLFEEVILEKAGQFTNQLDRNSVRLDDTEVNLLAKLDQDQTRALEGQIERQLLGLLHEEIPFMETSIIVKGNLGNIQVTGIDNSVVALNEVNNANPYLGKLMALKEKLAGKGIYGHKLFGPATYEVKMTHKQRLRWEKMKALEKMVANLK